MISVPTKKHDIKRAPARINGISPSIIRAVSGCAEIRALCDQQCGLSPHFIPAGSLGFALLQIGLQPTPGKEPEMFMLIYWPDYVNEAGMIMMSAHRPDMITPTGRRVQ